MSVNSMGIPDYFSKLKSVFSVNNDRVFLADYSKGTAVRAVKELVGGGTQLFVVKNQRVAKDVAAQLFSNEEATVINSQKELKTLVDAVFGANASDEKYRLDAAKFKEKYPKIVVVESQDKEPILHCELCKDKQLSGMYREKFSAFRFSDLLTACAYDSLVLDDVYGILEFIDPVKTPDIKFTPSEYDRLYFFGKEYFADGKHSYKRLKNIADSAKKVVLLAPLVLDESVVEFYAALNLLSKESVSSDAINLMRQSGSKYKEDSQAINGEILNLVYDEMLLSTCLRLVASKTVPVPRGVEEMRSFIVRSFEYMSEEEACIKTVSAILKKAFAGKNPDVQDIFNLLFDEQSVEVIAAALVDLFFNDGIRSDVEGAISNVITSKLSAEEIKNIIALFNKSGFCSQCEKNLGGCKFLRIKRDDSGFEEYLRRKQYVLKDDENTYSVTEQGSDEMYKCVAIQRILDGRDKCVELKFPVLIVADDEKKATTQKILKGLYPKLKYFEDLDVLTRAEKNDTVVIVSYERFTETALWFDVGTIIFADVDYDVTAFKNAVCQAVEYNPAGVAILTSYGDLGAVAADKWKGVVLSSELKSVPVNSSVVSMKDRDETKYKDLFNRVEKTYVLLKKIVSGGDKSVIKEFIENFNSNVTSFSQEMPASEKDVKTQVGYLAEVGSSFNAVFANSKYIGDDGEALVSERYGYELRIVKQKIKKGRNGKPDKVVKKKTKYFEKIDKNSSKKVLFNVCAKMLRRDCHMLKNDCATCKELKKFVTNDYLRFVEGINNFFDKTVAYVEKYDKDRINSRGNDVIYNENADGCLSQISKDYVLGVKDKISEYIELEVDEQNISEGLITVDFESVNNVYKGIIEIYGQILDKYFTVLQKLIDTATEKSTAGFVELKQALLDK